MPEIAEAQAAKYLTHNEDLRILDATVQCVAISNAVSTPPGSPSDGDRYIVGAGATGVWSGHEDDLAYWRSSSWTFMVPSEGWHCYLLNLDSWYVYQSVSTGWVPTFGSLAYDIGASVNGIPTVSQVLLRAPMVRAVEFPDNFVGSVSIANVAATAQSDFLIKRNGTQIGYFRFAAAGTVATFTTSGSGVEMFAIADVLTVESPASPDSTLADIGFVFMGTKST